MRYADHRFKSIFKVKAFEWCDMINGKIKIRGMLKTFMDMAIDQFPYGVKKCPIEDKIATFIIPINNKFLKILPTGVYKMTAHGYSKEDHNIFYFSLLLKIDE